MTVQNLRINVSFFVTLALVCVDRIGPLKILLIPAANLHAKYAEVEGHSVQKLLSGDTVRYTHTTYCNTWTTKVGLQCGRWQTVLCRRIYIAKYLYTLAFSAEHLVDNRRNWFNKRYGETDNYLSYVSLILFVRLGLQENSWLRRWAKYTKLCMVWQPNILNNCYELSGGYAPPNDPAPIYRTTV